jgi:hypothetical protein
MVSLLLSNWKLVLMALLVAAVGLFYHLWRAEVDEFAAFKAQVAAEGEAAKIEAKRIDDLHQHVLKETTDAWNKQLPAIRAGAVSAYLARFGVRDNPGSGNVPSNAGGAQSADGTSQGGVATCAPGFVQDAAEDAGKVGAWQDWAKGNRLPVE